MKLIKGVMAAILALLPLEAMAEDTIKIGLFNRDAAIIAAEGKGFFKQENIRVEINTVTDSPTLLRNLIRGQYDLILNNADNVIAWAEGQGEDPQKNDFVIFLGQPGCRPEAHRCAGNHRLPGSQRQSLRRRRADNGLCHRRCLHPEKARPRVEPRLYV